MSKVIFLDVDGTLVTYENRIPASLYASEQLLSHLGIAREDTIAFGDAKVDIPMLSYCHIGVAMGNGGEEIRAMADYVTDDVENDGLYKAFQHLGLLG